MNCPACGCNSHRYTVAHPLTGQPLDLRHCNDCRREHSALSRDKWLLLPHYCAAPTCRAPVYRIVTHPRTGYPEPLWCNPEHIVAVYRVTKGPDGKDPRKTTGRRHVGPYPITYQPYCSTACAPAIGAPPSHQLEEGGVPHRYTIGPCVRHLRARDRHAEEFTPERGAFFRVWLAEELRLPETERDALIAQWAADAAS